MDEPRRAFSEEEIARIDGYLEAQIALGDIPGAALVLVEGEHAVHMRGFGQSRPDGTRVTASTPFKLGSVSKSFTAVAIAELADRGAIELDAPVQRYVSWFTVGSGEASARITVRELLTHTSGISLASGRRSFADTDASEAALERAVRALAHERLQRPPGAGFQYSNANYQTLGIVIESVSGQSFSAFVEQNVFRPLGMTTSFADETQARAHGAAIGSRYWFGLPIAAPDVPAPKSLEPAAELYVSAQDMGAYLGALLGDGQREGVRVLSSSAAKALFAPTARTKSGLGYGMGWFVTPGSMPFGVWHDGSTPSFHAHVALDPATHRGFALLVNAETYLSGPKIGDLGLGVVRILRGETPQPLPRPALPPELLALLAIAAVQIAGFVLWWRGRATNLGTVRIAAMALAYLTVAMLLVFVAPRIQQTTWLGVLVFAPDAGYLLLGNAGFAIVCAASWVARLGAHWAIRAGRAR